MKRSLLVAAFVVCLAPAASAHVTIQPTEAPTGAFFRFDVRVPNERDDASTTSVKVELPDLVFVSFQPKPGWERDITMKKLDEPIEVFGTTYDEVIDSVTWSGGKIGPGEFDEFGFSARVPDEATTLEFAAEQVYTSGEVVRWDGGPDSEEPAPLVDVVALGGGEDSGELEVLAELHRSVGRLDEMMDAMHSPQATGSEGSEGLALTLGGIGAASGLIAVGISMWSARRKAGDETAG